jgi:hypothetical protein
MQAEDGDPATYAHTLSLRLTGPDYRRLRRFAAAREERFGRRVTHQGVLETALRQFLEREGEEG